jgi:hypothetical protein
MNMKRTTNILTIAAIIMAAVLFSTFALAGPPDPPTLHVYQPVTAYTTAQSVPLRWGGGSPDIFTEFTACNKNAAGGDSVWLDPTGTTAATVALESPSPCTAALAGLGAGNVNAGTHSYKVTFVAGSYESYGSPASATVTTTAGNGQIALSAIPLGRTGTTARKIYRTAAGGTTYKLLTTIADNATTVFADNVADINLTTTLATNIGYTSWEIEPAQCLNFAFPKTGSVSVITLANTAVVKIGAGR